MKMKGVIKWKVKPTHPDIQGIPEEYWKDKLFTYEDEYSFDPEYEWTEESAVEYIKRDLKLVAGGGYNCDHIYDVEIETEDVTDVPDSD